MPAKSISQQQAAGQALAAKRGELSVSKLQGASKDMYDSMSEKELEKFAKTKHTNLPDKVEESVLEVTKIDNKKLRDAEKRGRQAANKGKRRAPIMDKKFILSLPDSIPGESAPYYKAWLHGYDKENLKTEIKKIINELLVEAKFIKKPIPIDAEKLKKPEEIETLEGKVTGNTGDWKVKGPEGEKWPVNADVFKKTYKPLDDEAKEMMKEVDIKKEYDQYAKLNINKLKDIYGRSHSVSDTKGMSKDALISGILRAQYGNKKVSAAMQTEALKPGEIKQMIAYVEKTLKWKKHEYQGHHRLNGYADAGYIWFSPSYKSDLVLKFNGNGSFILKHRGAKIGDEIDGGYGLNALKKLKIPRDETYVPAEYPSMRDPYRQGGFSPYTTVSYNGLTPVNDRDRIVGKVKRKGLGRKRPRLKEQNGSIKTYARLIVKEMVEEVIMKKSELRKLIREEVKHLLTEANIKGLYATNKVILKHGGSTPFGQGFYIDINGFAHVDASEPHDAATIEMIDIDDGSKFGASLEDTEIPYKDAYRFVANRIKSTKLTRFFNQLRKAARIKPTATVHVRLRALIKPSLKGKIRFVEYDSNRFEFKL